MQVEKELQEIRERLAQVDEWRRRREEIESELAAVWTEKGGAMPLEPPAYTEEAGEGEKVVTE
jgi:ATP-binding cassette subfamily D (ALD) long-chain fatty acid import protein